MSAVLGLDIGGANLKAAHSGGGARLMPFALWKQPRQLAERLGDLVRSWPEVEVLAVTMTAELCDCFASKSAGVRAILEAVEKVRGGRSVRVWTTRGRFVDLADALSVPLPAAAANWLALATWVACTFAVSDGVLLDLGSTTTDIVPLIGGRAAPCGFTDHDRLRAGELVYTGVRRTPLCALMGPKWGQYSLAAEFFATTLDVYLVLGS